VSPRTKPRCDSEKASGSAANGEEGRGDKLGLYAGDFNRNGQVQNTDLQPQLVPNIGRGQAF